MTHVRHQLSLFLPPGDFATQVERVRHAVDPVQSALIAAHVTLCREDELSDAHAAERRIANEKPEPIALRFGRVEAFHGHGLLLPCTDGQDEFHRLRQRILGRTDIRTQEPHITLAHPRNPRAPGNSLAVASALAEGVVVVFSSIRLIRQDGAAPWQTLRAYDLRDPG
ncbi:MAG: 2'-5' RNA ligase family protein [Gemmatimonadaceae bacterium]|nr:2'-5' RNA ligase family protein [Gemmatimonadaceae bacterium]